MSTEVNQRIGLNRLRHNKMQYKCEECSIRTMNNLKRIVSLSGNILAAATPHSRTVSGQLPDVRRR